MSDKDSSELPEASHFTEFPSAEMRGLDLTGLLGSRVQSAIRADAGTTWRPPMPEELGRLLPQYRVESLLGRGGMGAVYKGKQVALDRAVAIKLLPVEIAADEQFVARFRREARTLAKLQHSRIVTIHDFGETSEGRLYFVMEYVDGTDLRKILRGSGLHPAQTLRVVSEICDALHAAHSQGVIHRDIKPENILITKDGSVKLADFGIARPMMEDGAASLTMTNVAMGTAAYMAPEQHKGQADERADIFALGVMLYEMLTGRTPRGAFEPASKKSKLDARIDDVVSKALDEEPERRYQRVSEMKTDVDAIRNTLRMARGSVKSLEASVELPERAVAQPGVLSRRLSKSFLSTACLCVLLLGAGGYFLWQGRTSSAVLPAATPLPIPGLQPVNTSTMRLIADVDFSRGLSRFPIGDDTRFQSSLVNGEYHLLCRESGLWWPEEPALQELRVNDCVCEVCARLVRASDGGWGIGLVSGSGAGHPWTGVMVNGSNRVSSHSYDDGADLPWISTPAMRAGEMNTIRVEAFGARIRLFVNGVFVFERQHERLKPDSSMTLYAFGENPPEETAFQSVRVWVPQ